MWRSRRSVKTAQAWRLWGTCRQRPVACEHGTGDRPRRSGVPGTDLQHALLWSGQAAPAHARKDPQPLGARCDLFAGDPLAVEFGGTPRHLQHVSTRCVRVAGTGDYWRPDHAHLMANSDGDWSRTNRHVTHWLFRQSCISSLVSWRWSMQVHPCWSWATSMCRGTPGCSMNSW